jgi:hypothetical protein
MEDPGVPHGKNFEVSNWYIERLEQTNKQTNNGERS